MALPRPTPSTLLTAFCCLLAASLLGIPQQPAPITWGPWHVLGPFDHPKGYKDIKPSHKPEKQLKLMKGGEGWDGLTETYRGRGKPKLEWKRLGDPAKHDATAIDAGLINFQTAISPPVGVKNWADHSVAYLYREVISPRHQEIKIRFGSDDAVRFWLNGENLVTNSVGRGVNPQEESAKLKLLPGKNHILVKVSNGDGGWGFQMQKPNRTTQKAVNAAIEKGVNYLLSRQLIDGSWELQQGPYRNGATSLIVYTLVKSGVSPRHPAILEALAYLAESPTAKTYSVGCHLMALDALADEDYLPWMEELLGDLLSWQDRHGVWGYPGGHPDLSCTQFAALGLRAAEHRGLEVPEEAWVDLAEGVLDHQLKKKKVDTPRSALEEFSSTINIAGFSYRSDNPKTATGSMTTAGIATLEICRRALGDRIPESLKKRIERQIDLGLNWMIKDWSVSSNPRRGSAHLHYYLYGLERVGSILNLERIGDQDWYWQGATFLVKSQNANQGHWPDAAGRAEAATCFALLFLERATRSAVTDPHGSSKKSVVKSEAKGGPIQFSAMSGSPASFWFHGKDASMANAEIEIVEYHVRKPEKKWRVASIAYAPEQVRENERYAGRYTFEEPGIWEIKAVAHCAGDQTFVSGILKLDITDAMPGNISSYPRDAGQNLIPRNQPKATASSGSNAKSLVDNHFFSRWVCANKDANPEFTIELKRTVKADRLLLSHARTRPSEQQNNPRVSKLLIWLDSSKTPIEVNMELEYRKKTLVVFPETRSVRKIRIQVVAVEGGELGKCSVGFTEVELQGPRKRRGRR